MEMMMMMETSEQSGVTRLHWAQRTLRQRKTDERHASRNLDVSGSRIVQQTAGDR